MPHNDQICVTKLEIIDKWERSDGGSAYVLPDFPVTQRDAVFRRGHNADCRLRGLTGTEVTAGHRRCPSTVCEREYVSASVTGYCPT